MVLEARRLVDEDQRLEDVSFDLPFRVLDQFGYSEAAEYVYGMPYEDWKAKYQHPSSPEQMEKFKASQPLHAKHDKEILQKRPSGDPSSSTTVSVSMNPIAQPSNVCCQGIDKDPQPGEMKPSPSFPAKKSRPLPSFQVPALPSDLPVISCAVLTVSDRASRNEYETGDLSGPAVQEALRNVCSNVLIQHTAIVPDDLEKISDTLQKWCAETISLIVTTGGTGMSPRDVTPEATRKILSYECQGLMTFALNESSKIQPLASLSRGTAGIRQNTFIVNLPGNPRAIHELVPILFPLVAHAIQDLN